MMLHPPVTTTDFAQSYLVQVSKVCDHSLYSYSYTGASSITKSTNCLTPVLQPLLSYFWHQLPVGPLVLPGLLQEFLSPDALLP